MKKVRPMSHAEFIEYMKEHGITIHRITRARVYLMVPSYPEIKVPPQTKFYDEELQILQNIDITKPPFISIPNLLKNNLLIEAIKTFKALTGFSLKDSKDIVLANREEWVKL